MDEMSPFHRACLAIIERRGRANPISYQDLAALLAENPRMVRRTVEELIMVHHLPICSSYDPRRPGYFWPATPEEIADTCGRLIRHGVAIIRRARAIGRYSAEEVFGQLKLIMTEDE